MASWDGETVNHLDEKFNWNDGEVQTQTYGQLIKLMNIIMKESAGDVVGKAKGYSIWTSV